MFPLVCPMSKKKYLKSSVNSLSSKRLGCIVLRAEQTKVAPR